MSGRLVSIAIRMIPMSLERSRASRQDVFGHEGGASIERTTIVRIARRRLCGIIGGKGNMTQGNDGDRLKRPGDALVRQGGVISEAVSAGA